MKPKVYYTDVKLKKALDAIRIHGKGLRQTAKAFGIPHSTLHDRITGKRDETLQPKGPEPVLGAQGEELIKDWLINITRCGFPIKKDELLNTVQNIIKDNGTHNPFKDDRPGPTWYRNFLKRHPDLSTRASKAINNAKERITEKSIRSWFAGLETFLMETNNQDILKCPERIFNGDEMGVGIGGLSMCPKTGKVLAPNSYRNLHQIKWGTEKDNLTVLVTLNAKGQICPPLIVFPSVRPQPAVVSSLPADWCLKGSESGKTHSDVFLEYITNDFNNWVGRNQIKKPILLLVDGYRSHMSLALSALCEKQQIILYALPPYTAPMLQPVDVTVFGPLKSSWKTIVTNFLSYPENLNSCATETNFCNLLKAALDDTNMEQYIRKGFRICGLYPFNPDFVDYGKCGVCNEALPKKVIKRKRNIKNSTTSIAVLTSSKIQVKSEKDVKASINVLSTLKTESSTYDVPITEPSSHGTTDAALDFPSTSKNTNTQSLRWAPQIIDYDQALPYAEEKEEDQK